MAESDNGRVARRGLVIIGLMLATITVLFLGYEARRVLTPIRDGHLGLPAQMAT